jgi:hypothetical protein
MTTEVYQSPPGDPPPPEPKKNVFARIAGVLFAPVETFAEIVRRPDILGPLLVIVILGYIGTAVVLPRLDVTAMTDAQAEQMRKQNPNVREEQIATIARYTAASVKVFAWIGPVIFIAWYAIVAGALLLAFRLFGGEGTYKQAFSVTLYAWMPMVLLSLITAVVVMAQGTFDPTTAATIVKSNPAFLVDMKEQPVLFSLLSSFDLFTIWTIALLSVGFAAVARTTKAKAATIVVSLWLAMIVVKLGFAALGAARMKK